jgi:hypothetical protein
VHGSDIQYKPRVLAMDWKADYEKKEECVLDVTMLQWKHRNERINHAFLQMA